MRTLVNYSDRSSFTHNGIPVDWLYPGLYKIRLRPYGPWVPVRITMEDGDRDPDTWELLSDQKLRAEWWPKTNSAQSFDVNPSRFFNKARPITKEEFEWLIILRKMSR